MTTTTPNAQPAKGIKPHIVSREFNAPRDLVWNVNTQADHLEKWLGPEGVTGITKSMDFRVGGVYHYAQRSLDGSMTMWGKMTYLEIDPIDRIVSVQSFSDENGGIGTHPLVPNWPKVMHWVMDFEDLGNDRTRLTVTWRPVEDASADELATFESMRSGMDQGWKGTFEKLEKYLANMRA
jgi:uncharacterized protein YndB with AHSA1/START domain